MNKNITFLLLLSLVGLAVGYVLSRPQSFGICGGSIFCYNLTTNGFAVFYGMGALAVVFFGLLLVPKAWNTWWKFASWFVPLTALLFVFYPEPGSGDLFSPYPETVYQWMSGLYIGVSIVIIAISYMQKGPQNPS